MSQRFIVFVLLLYFLSGLSSLAYEVLWVRMLSLVFGVSIFGVVITVAVFMAGLGLGSMFAVKRLRLHRHPLKYFAILECCVALSSLIIPFLFHTIDQWLVGLAPAVPLYVWYSLQFSVVGIILFIPAFLMGVGFPLILKVFDNTPVSLGLIYGLNTLGAAIGALLPLVLLPVLGWMYSLVFVAVIGLSVAASAFFAARRFVAPSASDVASGDSASTQLPSLRLLVAYTGIGSAALILEIGWTRLFGMIFLRTEYVLAIILSIFLVGIGLGSVLARYLRRDFWYSLLPFVVSGFAIAGLWFLPSVSSWIDLSQFDSLFEALVMQGLIIASITLPVTLVFGAWLPLFCHRCGATKIGGAWLYGVNSVGAAFGALIAGFVLIPVVGTNATIVIAAALLLLFSWVWVANKWILWLTPLFVLLSFPVLHMPAVHEIMPDVYAGTQDVYRYEDAVSISHVIERDDGQRLLLADLRRMDASSDPISVESQKNQARLPLLLHPKPTSILFLGLGTGISASGVLVYPDLQATAVELSMGAILSAESWFKPVNGGVMDYINVVRDDAKHFLISDSHLYDVIVGDLFHPDLVGRSALLSRQQFERVRNRLSDDGIFVQWLALNQFETASLDIILRTFREVYPNAVMFLDAFRLALVGPKSNSPSATAVLDNLSRLALSNKQAATGNETPWTWLGRYWGPITTDVGVIQDEWAPQIEFRLPGARYNGELDLVKLLAHMLRQRPHVKQAAIDLLVSDIDFAVFERAYVATELAHRSWLALLQQKNQEGQRLLKLAYQANPKDRWIGFAIADASLASYDSNRPVGLSEREVLQSVLKIRPDHVEALKRLWQLALNEGDSEQARRYYAQLAKLSPLDGFLRQ
ncbi:MAG: spermine synthase [Gammaproteobacteria bacterium]|nr:spermine synthase [Gammaproteobacteria bacterium]